MHGLYIVGPSAPRNVTVTEQHKTHISLSIQTNEQEQVNGFRVVCINTRNESFNETVKNDSFILLNNLTSGTKYNISVFATIIVNGSELISDGAFNLTAYTRKS